MQNFLPHPAQTFRLEPEPPRESDIPAEWRNDLFKNYGEVVEPFTIEESDAAETDRR
jgi:hypothetical protein